MIGKNSKYIDYRFVFMICRFHYELLIANGLILNDDIIASHKWIVQRPPQYVDAALLGNHISTVTNYTIGVRIALTQHDTKSMIEHFEHLEIYPIAIDYSNNYTEYAIILLCVVFAIIAMGTCYYVSVIKPKRYKTMQHEETTTPWRLHHNQSYENPLTDNASSEYTNSVRYFNDARPLIEPETPRLSTAVTPNVEMNNN